MPAQKIEVKEFSDNQAQDMHSVSSPLSTLLASLKHLISTAPQFSSSMPKLPIPDILSRGFLHTVSPLGLSNTATPTGLLRWIC